MLDDGHFSGNGDGRFFHATPFGDPQTPGLERRPSLDASQLGGGLEQVGPDERVTAFGDPAVLVGLARLVTPWRQAQISTDAA